MTRGAVLVSGGGTKLQALLDSVYFGEIPDFELVAVISSDPQAYALTRAKTAGVPGYTVDPAMLHFTRILHKMVIKCIAHQCAVKYNT